MDDNTARYHFAVETCCKAGEIATQYLKDRASLVVEENGFQDGVIEEQDAGDMIRHGGRVVAGTKDVFSALQEIADRHWGK